MIIHLAVDMHDAVVAVSDRGCGFAGDAVLRRFDAFYTTKDEGMGMRLAICQCIVNDHGRSIRAEYRPCGDTRFVVRLPHLAQAAIERRPQESRHQAAECIGGRKHGIDATG
jgi:C4-dicarboxylate-specific signal transduction histidine kinase